jgi:hypothetical protein
VLALSREELIRKRQVTDCRGGSRVRPLLFLSPEEPIRKRQVTDSRYGSRMFPVLVLSREEFIPSAKSHTVAVEAERFQCSC